ncbi:MAG: hypothetical protein E4G99_12330 [Anaerolineales bacterium]|nr:MAG: hypothetical protein E4G99_12330 [Anaerolineales bacterium]
MRVVLFAPTSSSLYSRLVAHELQRQAAVDLVGIFVRRLWSYKRIRTDLRREGPRLLQKIYSKLILPEKAAIGQEQDPMRALAVELGLDFKDLAVCSQRNGISYREVLDFNAPACQSALEGLSPDLIVFTGGGLIRKNILGIPTLGVLNCHSGLLPRYRGMDTLEWALLEADQAPPTVGLTLHFMDPGVDTGPILRQHLEDLKPGDTLDAVRRRLEPAMVRMVSRGVRELQSGELEAQAQERSAGQQYFVIHPRLQTRAALKLSRAWD